MISAGLQLQQAGAAVLLQHGGESVTFRTLSITVTIDRMPRPQSQGRRLDFDARDRSSVFLPIGSVTTHPKTGEVFLDSFGMTHRIESFTFNGSGWICECKTSGTPTQPA